MASPGNRHCANCIGAFSFPVSMTTAVPHSWTWVRLAAVPLLAGNLGQVVYTHSCASVPKQHNLVPVKGR